MNLNVTLVQSSLYWEDTDRNLDHFSKLTDKIIDPADLIVLPEMFSTGFTMHAELFAEDMNGKAIQWMSELAFQKKCVITGSLIIKDNDRYYNRLIWMRPDRSCEYYDKRHLFRISDENLCFSSGNRRLITELKGWRICPLICYDLRFPVWSRNTNGYDLLIYVANWPESRINVWKTLLSARAMENLCYVAGVNRTGRDGQGADYSGGSALIDFKGTLISSLNRYEEGVISAILSKNDLLEFRQKFPGHLDADRFEIPDSQM